jgi:hypothetical protein
MKFDGGLSAELSKGEGQGRSSTRGGNSRVGQTRHGLAPATAFHLDNGRQIVACTAQKNEKRSDRNPGGGSRDRSSIVDVRTHGFLIFRCEDERAGTLHGLQRRNQLGRRVTADG